MATDLEAAAAERPALQKSLKMYREAMASKLTPSPWQDMAAWDLAHFAAPLCDPTPITFSEAEAALAGTAATIIEDHGEFFLDFDLDDAPITTRGQLRGLCHFLGITLHE